MNNKISVVNDKPLWILDKEFVDEASGLVVQVKRLDLPRPKFSLNVGKRLPDGKFAPFIHPQYAIDNATLTLTAFNGARLGWLYDEALLYIEEQLQAGHFAYLAEKEKRETERLARARGSVNAPRDPGKTAREADKRARHEHNVSAKADANRSANKAHLGRGAR